MQTNPRSNDWLLGLAIHMSHRKISKFGYRYRDEQTRKLAWFLASSGLPNVEPVIQTLFIEAYLDCGAEQRLGCDNDRLYAPCPNKVGR